MITTLRQSTHCLVADNKGGYLVVDRSLGTSVGRVARAGKRRWSASVRDRGAAGWVPTAMPRQPTRAAAAVECMRAHLGHPLPL